MKQHHNSRRWQHRSSLYFYSNWVTMLHRSTRQRKRVGIRCIAYSDANISCLEASWIQKFGKQITAKKIKNSWTEMETYPSWPKKTPSIQTSLTETLASFHRTVPRDWNRKTCVEENYVAIVSFDLRMCEEFLYVCRKAQKWFMRLNWSLSLD